MSDQPSSFKETDVTPTEPQPVTPEVAPQPAEPTAPVFKMSDKTQEYVGAGKKYTSAEAALEAIPYAQSHIDTLEQENSRLRGDLDRASKLDDAVSRIAADADQNARPAVPEYDQATVREEARSVFNEISEENQKAANVAVANEAMFKLYGDKLAEVTASVAKDLGLSVEFLKATAERSPQAFLKLVSDNKDSGSGLPQSDQSTINSNAIDSNLQPPSISAKIPSDGSTKSLVSAWRAAGQAVA